MKPPLLLTFLIMPALLHAQAPVETERNPWLPDPTELPRAVKEARILSRRVAEPATATKGRVIIEAIAPPAWPAPAAPAAIPPVSRLTMEERAARRASEPNELVLFSPTVLVYDNGLSLVRWWTADRFTGYQEYIVWVQLDLSDIQFCGDLIVDRRRYCLMPMMFHARERYVSRARVPALTDFPENSDIIVTKGDISNQEAMAPLLALVAKFDSQGDQIRDTAAAVKADQAARAAWEKANPKKPRDTVIKHWVIQSGLPPQQPLPAAPAQPAPRPAR